MAGEVSKQDQALAQAAGRVGQAKQDLDGQLNNLRQKLDGIGSQWQGAGAVAFNQLMLKWNEDAKKIISALDQFQANLQKSEQEYAATDEAQQQSFSRLAGRLNN